MIRRLFGIGRGDSVQEQVVATTAPVDTPEEIQVLCHNVEAKIFGLADVLPTMGTVLSLRVVDLEREVLGLSKTLDGSTRYMMRHMLSDYLPSLIDAFVLASRSGIRDEKEFSEQVSVMVGSMEEVLEAVATDNARALTAQGVFLENKFGGSDLA